MKNYLKKRHLSLLDNDYNESKLQYNKQPVEEIFTQRAAKTTIQILYDKNLSDGFPRADKVLIEFLFVTRRRPDLEKENIDIIQ